MRSLLVMWNPYPQAPEVSIVRTDTCTEFALVPVKAFREVNRGGGGNEGRI
jgi:hypothetical protein